MGFTDEEKEEMTDLFKLFDKDEDGKIDIDELASCVRAMGLNPSEPEVEEIKKKAGGGPQVGVEAFFTVMDGHGIKNDTEDMIIEAFKIFDNQGKGKIPLSELVAIYTNMGEKFSEEEAAQLRAVAPVDDKNMVDYVEFVKMQMSA